MQETWLGFLGREDNLVKEMATPSGILAWRIPWPEESGRPQSMGLQESDTTKRGQRLKHSHNAFITHKNALFIF